MTISLSLERSCSNDLVIMIDALRASTTITSALQRFNTVIPVKSIENAVNIAGGLDATLAGEREGAKIEGFDVVIPCGYTKIHWRSSCTYHY